MNEADRISMAMGYCPRCQRPYVGGDASKHVGVPRAVCIRVGDNVICNKEKQNERRRTYRTPY